MKSLVTVLFVSMTLIQTARAEAYDDCVARTGQRQVENMFETSSDIRKSTKLDSDQKREILARLEGMYSAIRSIEADTCDFVYKRSLGGK